MTDAEGLTLVEIADLVGGHLEGDGGLRVVGVAPVDEAGPGHLAFLALKRYARYAESCGALGFLVSTELRGSVPAGRPCVVVDEAYPALRTLLMALCPPETLPAGVHPTAVVGRGATLGEGVHIGPYAVIDEGASIGARTVVEAHSVVGRNATIGAGCRLHPHVVVYHGSLIGSDVIIHSGACVGSDGFGYTFVDGAHRKMPQVGRAVIEDEVEIGANVTIDRGSLGDTVIGAGSKIDNLVHLAHNVKIGALSLFAALSGVAGSTRLGKQTWVGGRVGIINQLDVGDGARIAVGSMVMRDVPAGETVSGYPARPHREGMRRQAQVARLPRLMERLDKLEEEVERLSGLS